MSEQQNVGQRDEKYPPFVSMGEGYTMREARIMKKRLENEMKTASNTIEVKIDILPLEGMNAKPNQYYVHNTSTYKK